MTSIRPYRVPGRGIFMNSYHTGLQIFAVLTNGPGIPYGAVPGGGPALFRHVSPFCFRGICVLLLHVRGNFSAGHLVAEDGTKKYLRMMKISAMAPTLTRFCTASSWPTIMWRAMA